MTDNDDTTTTTALTGTDGLKNMINGYADLTSLDNPYTALLINAILVTTGVIAYQLLTGWLQWLAVAWIVVNFYGVFNAAIRIGGNQ